MQIDDTVKFESLKDRIVRAVQQKMSPPGALGLPPLLDERRLEYLVPDVAFKVQPCFDRVFVAQALHHSEEGEHFVEGGLIVKPQTSQSRSARELPRGLLVSAGIIALDALRSHGIDLGHMVSFTNQMPWQLPLGRVGDAENSMEFSLLQMRAGDISGSEETRKLMLAGRLQVVAHAREDGVVEHRYELDGKPLGNPIEPFSGQDY